MKLKPYVIGTAILVGWVWAVVIVFALTTWTWMLWMTCMGIAYSLACIALGTTFYFIDRRRHDSGRG